MTSLENALLPGLVKTAGIVYLGLDQTLLEILPLTLASVSKSNSLYTIFEQIVLALYYHDACRQISMQSLKYLLFFHVAAIFLTLDATSYGAFEGVPNVEVCVFGSVGTGDLSDIAGESFEVDLALSDGTATGRYHYIYVAVDGDNN